MNAKATLIGIGGAGLSLMDKAYQLFPGRFRRLGIDMKGDWNIRYHELINIDYQRIISGRSSKSSYVSFYEEEDVQEMEWVENSGSFDELFAIPGRFIVIAGIFGNTAGFVSYKLLKELNIRNKRDVVFIAVGPWGFEWRCSGDRHTARIAELRKSGVYVELLNNQELIRGYEDCLMDKCYEIADEKILKRIGEII